MELVSFVFVAFAVSCVRMEIESTDTNDLSNGDNPIRFSKLPVHVKKDLYKIVAGPVGAPFLGMCKGTEPDYNKVELLLYNDIDNYTRIYPNNFTGIDLNAPLYILSHGYLSGLYGYKVKAFRDKYIQVYRKNILFVNWGRLAWRMYSACMCDIPFLGVYVAQLLCGLSGRHKYDLKNVHIIGHSMGAQLAGHAGKATQTLCNKKIGKITGLDPAGPMYQFVDSKGRLVPSDADFVEVVHSSAGFFGYMGKAGTIDYHLNCGTNQPGCIIPIDFIDILDKIFYLFACPHMRALEIWPYVLDSKEFKAKSCTFCAGVFANTCFSDIFSLDYISLGHTYTPPKSQHYYLKTGPKRPFMLGCTAFPFQGCS